MTYKIPAGDMTPPCAVGMCADSQLASPAVWLLPQVDALVRVRPDAQALPPQRYGLRFVLVCEQHADLWWDGDEPMEGLPHYRLVEAPVVNHSPQWPVGPVGVE